MNRLSIIRLIAVVAVLGGFGTAFILHSKAATLSTAKEAEAGTLNNVATVSDSAASQGKAVLFGGQGSGGGDTGPLGARMQFGAFTDYEGSSLSAAVTSLETKIGHKVSPVQYFTDTTADFELAECQKLAASGHSMLIAMEPDGTTQNIINGGKDAFIKKFATDVAKCGTQVYIRVYPEMNGSFTTYSPYHDRDYPGDAASAHTTSKAQLISAYKHIIDTYRTVNTTTKWVFAPNQTDDPTDATNKMEDYFPGAAYNDILAFDAYNWGDGGPFGSWQSAHDVYIEPYTRLTALQANVPVWVTETSSKEPQINDGYGTNPGKSKGQWITQLFAETGFPRMKAIIWFDIDKHTTNPATSGERDWRVDSSTDSLNALKAALKNTP